MKDEYLYKTKKPKLATIIRKTVFFIIESALCVLLGYLIVRFAIEKTIMVGNSMEKTLNGDDVLIVNKLAYFRDTPDRFDVIAFNQSRNEHSFYNIKRVIGLPGDKIQISGGKVFINGEELKEKISVEEMRLPGLAEDEITLLENEYFVLGDNRNLSEDSRYSNIGLVSGNDIIGKVVLRISPELAIVDKLNLRTESSGENK
jgi:signal peptidase I